MPSGSTLSPLSNSSSLRKFVSVTFLNGASLTLPAEGKTRVCEAEAQVANYLQNVGMRDTDLFGLAFKIDDEFVFVDGENKLSKYASRQWKASSNGLDNSGHPLLKFEYRVKYYVESNLFIRDHVSRLHYYLQLRENLLSYGQVHLEDAALLLASIALQADLGDYDSDRNRGQYFDPTAYVPQKILNQMGVSYLLERIPGFHRKHKGLSQAAAHAHFIREASQSEAPHNIHLYHLRRKKHDPSSTVALSVCDTGIGVYEEDLVTSSKKLLQTFWWSNIEDLSFDKKKFEIRNPMGKLTLYTSNDEKSKHLFRLCILTHSRTLRMTEQHLKSSNHDRRSSRESFSFNSSSFQDMSGNEGLSIEGFLDLDANPSSNPNSGVVSDRILSGVVNEDLGSSGASISRSLSIASSIRTQSPDQDREDITPRGLQYTPPGTPDVNSWDLLTRCGESSGFGRTSSIHSSSSQHSASTVRSRYPLVASRHHHELALGAQLADLSLAPDLPDLADLPAMAADMAARGEDVPDSGHHMHSTSHNCCSTCCDDNASICSDEEDREGRCRCGSCNICLLQEDDSQQSMYLGYRSNNPSSHQLFQTNPVFGADDDSVAAQPDLDDTAVSSYNFSEEDFLQLDNNDDYVEFYKGGLSYQDQSLCLTPQDVPLEERVADSSTLIENSGASSKSRQSSPVEEEQHLDYSVESAQASLATSYPLNKEMLTWALLMGAQNQGHQGAFAQPAPVSMSKVITTTPVNVASSRFNGPATSPDAKNNPNNFLSDSMYTPETLISEVAAACPSEAPAKFITSKPRITVLTAHTQLAATTAPSYSSVPLTRAKVHTLPQVQGKSKVDAIQSLQRVALPDPRPLGFPSPYCTNEDSAHCSNFFSPAQSNVMPVIRGNNYLDVHASANLNRERLRTHPEQLPSKTPRSLYLKNQKKKLHQQTLQEKNQIEQLQQKLLSDTVYQPAAYAQGVGVPLKPAPTYVGCPNSKSPKHPIYDPRIALIQQHHPNKIGPSYHMQPQQACYQQEPSHQNMLYQPHIRNFFQNPPPPAPHPGYGIGVCPGSQSINPELFSPTYQCASDPGTYPISSASHLQPKQTPLATVYTKQVTLSQIEQFKAQLNSDTDYVIYPHKDPALSRQEYMDAKQSQVIASQAQQQYGMDPSMQYTQMPPPYRSPKASPHYRSTPNVAGDLLTSFPSYQSLASTHQPGSSSGYSSMARGRYFSQQSLASSFSSAPSTQSLTGSFDPYADPPPLPSSPPAVIRVRSDESILSSSALTESDSLNARPPPPYRPKEVLNNSRTRQSVIPASGVSSTGGVTLQQVRDCGSQLDVPLLAALCSDSTLQNTSSKSVRKSSKSLLAQQHQSASKSSRRSAAKSRIDDAFETPEIPTKLSSCRYSLSGVYTTNQVPGPQVTAKSLLVKPSNGLHHHPRLNKTKSQSQPNAHSAKLKHTKSSRE